MVYVKYINGVCIGYIHDILMVLIYGTDMAYMIYTTNSLYIHLSMDI